MNLSVGKDEDNHILIHFLLQLNAFSNSLIKQTTKVSRSSKLQVRHGIPVRVHDSLDLEHMSIFFISI